MSTRHTEDAVNDADGSEDSDDSEDADDSQEIDRSGVLQKTLMTHKRLTDQVCKKTLVTQVCCRVCCSPWRH